ncbi:MAG: tail fiber domain-containing protein [Bacteroidetes bacterium]|nr:tail fiber domain-containing protein [Bacteroidota bacterium]
MKKLITIISFLGVNSICIGQVLNWNTNGNVTTAGDILGTTNLQPINFSTNNTVKMVLGTNGNLGIGTANPSAKLDILGSFSVDGVRYRSNNNGGNAFEILVANSPTYSRFKTFGDGKTFIGQFTSPANDYDAAGSILTVGQPFPLNLAFNVVSNTSPSAPTNLFSVYGSGVTSIKTNVANLTDDVFSITNTNGNSKNFVVKNNGQVGVLTANPQDAFHVTSNNNNGITITQTTFGSSLLSLDNLTSGGHKFVLGSTGTGNSQGSGNFSIYDYTSAADRFLIDGQTGNITLGAKISGSLTGVSSDLIKLHVHNEMYPYSTFPYNSYSRYASSFDGEVKESFHQSGGRAIGVSGNAYANGTGIYANCVGVAGNASNYYSSAVNVGVEAVASGGQTAYGLYAQGYQGATNATGDAIGIDCEANANGGNAIAFQAIGASTAGSGIALAGWFIGDVQMYGDLLVSTIHYTSDRKLKNDIKPFINGLSAIKQLKPSTYTFKTDEFKDMRLPKGNQIGLIAQEVEQIFPELVEESPALTRKNKEGKITTQGVGHKSINYVGLIPVMISGIQEQQVLIEQQNEKNDSLVNQTNKLVQQVNDQQKQIDELKAIVQSLANNTDATKSNNSLAISLSDKNAIVLNQNVPNPLAESTVISYSIPSDFTKAQIIFTTNDGKIIKSIDVIAKGEGRLNVFANDLSSGMYSYSLIVDGKIIDTKKMIKE